MSEPKPVRKFDPKRPYNDLPPLPPKAELETKAVLKLCIDARAALAEVDAACRTLPDPSILINAIPMLEAQASSAIENIVTTTDELFRQAQLDDGNPDPATKETLRYRTALCMGFDALATRPLSINLATEICRTLTGVDLDVRRTPGTSLRNLTTGEVIYSPPGG